MTISAICSREVITVHRDATVLHAAMLMRQYHVGDVLVIEDHEGKAIPVGILTDRDIVIELVATDLDCRVITVGDIMLAHLAVVKEDEGIFDAIQLMSSKGIRRLPVVDKDGSLLGIVTLDDMLQLLAKEFDALAKLVRREQKNEVSARR
jgi:CBS domain-containing protein